MSRLFNENMTYPEVQRLFFASVEGKSNKEVEEIKREYRSIVPVITKKELANNRNWLTSHPLK